MITLQNLIPDFSKKLLLKAAAAASVLFLSTAFPAFRYTLGYSVFRCIRL